MRLFFASVVRRRCLLWLSLAVLAAINSAGPLLAQSREGLLLEYTFEGDARDSSGNGHHGAIHGDPEFAAGKEGQCLVLDGDGDFIDSGTNFPDLRDTFTFECWVKPAATQNRYADILGNHAGGGITGYVIQQNNENVNSFNTSTLLGLAGSDKSSSDVAVHGSLESALEMLGEG